MAFSLRGILTLDNKGFLNGVNESVKATDKLGKGSEKATSSVIGIVKAGASLAGAYGIAKFAKDSLMLASNLVEVQNVVDTTFGSASKEINSFAKGASSKFGLSELQAKQFASTMGAMAKSSGISGKELTTMSTGLAGLSGDMASFFNLSPTEAFDKLKAGIAGETEPLRSLGINMSVANLQAYALKKGIKKSWQEMSQAEQTTLRYQYIMDATKDSQGDFNKTQGTFANQLRIATMGLQTMGASIGTLLLPIVNKGIVLFNKMINQINTGTGAFGKSVAFVKENKDIIIAAIAGITAGFTAYGVVLAAQAVATTIATAKQWLLNIAMDANPIGLIVTAIGALVAGIVWAYRKFDWFRKLVLGLWDLLKKLAITIKDVFTKVGDATVTEKAFRAGTVPQHANGTAYAMGGLTQVNERGGEIQRLRSGETIIPAEKSDRLLNGKSMGESTGIINLNLYMDGKNIASTVINRIVPELNIMLANS